MLNKVTDTAKELITFKAATTTIPYAKEIAKYFSIDNPLNSDFGFWASVLHFEMRYLSLDFFLEKSFSSAVLELSAGYSLRSLEYTSKNPDKIYFDTDLRKVMIEKKEMLKRLNISVPGNLKVQEFDVLNSGSILTKDQDLLIINEGLLMYFDREKQSQILKNIHSILQENGGTWVTADIYLKHETGSVGSDKDKKWERFFKSNNVMENYFDSFDQAEQFFYDNGFIIANKYEPEFEKFSSLPNLLNSASPQQLEALRSKGNIQQTWQLKTR